MREALRQLQSERLVEIRAHTGVRVTPVDIGALTEIFALLAALESASAIHALPRMTEADLQDKDAALQALENTAAAGDNVGFEQANAIFTSYPAVSLISHVQEQGLQSILAEWERLHRLSFKGTRPPNPEQANQDHRAIVHAFRQRDAERLTQVIHRHNSTALAHYQKLMK